eukprot:2919707-Amphidinium_carterae.1
MLQLRGLRRIAWRALRDLAENGAGELLSMFFADKDMPLADGKLEKVLKLCARSPLALSILGASKKSGKMGSDWTEVGDNHAALSKAPSLTSAMLAICPL